MPIPATADHRATPADALLEALRGGDALALAEACSRTLPAAYAVCRRFVPRADIEAVLRDVYASMWASPPESLPLERWVRQRCFDAAAALLRERQVPPAVPSAHALLPDLPAPATTFLDGTEQALAALDEDARGALLRAHDAGEFAADTPTAAAATRALLALAESDEHVAAGGARGADWVLGLLDAAEAATVADQLGAPGSETARALRRGRRRLEGLPCGPDVAPRLVAATLSGGPPTTAGAPAPGTGAPAARAAAAEHLTTEHHHGEQLHPRQVTAEQPAATLPAEPDDYDFLDSWESEEAADEAEPAPRRKALWALGWLLAIAVAVGAGMLIGRLLLDLQILS